MAVKITIKEIPVQHLATVPIIGIQEVPGAFSKLLQWADSQGLLTGDFKVLMVYHDSFKVTKPEEVRMSASLLVETPIADEKEIQFLTLPAGRHIVGSFEIPNHLFGQYWEQLFIWMNENGYEKADPDPFEAYHNDFNTHPQKLSIVDFCIPIKSLE